MFVHIFCNDHFWTGSVMGSHCWQDLQIMFLPYVQAWSWLLHLQKYYITFFKSKNICVGLGSLKPALASIMCKHEARILIVRTNKHMGRGANPPPTRPYIPTVYLTIEICWSLKWDPSPVSGGKCTKGETTEQWFITFLRSENLKKAMDPLLIKMHIHTCAIFFASISKTPSISV